MSATCRSCDAPIKWVEMPSGKKNPVDAEPVEGGNVIIEVDEEKQCTGRVLNDPEARRKHGGPFYRSHFSTCPDAKKFKR